MEEKELKEKSPLGANGSKRKEEEERLKKEAETAKVPFSKWRGITVAIYGGFLLIFLLTCLAAALGWPSAVVIILIILDLIAMGASIFFSIYTYKKFYTPYIIKQRKYEEYTAQKGNR